MAKRHGRTAAFWLADSGAVSRNLTSYLTNIDFPRSAETAQVTALQEDDHSSVPGVRGGTISLTGFHDETANGFDDVCNGILGGVGGSAASAFKYFPHGSVTGRIFFSGSAFVTAIAPAGGIQGAATETASLIVHGSVTRGTA